jgi:predicted phosphohydrolase
LPDRDEIYLERGMRVAWLADLHLNFMNERGRRRFVDRVAATKPDAVLIGGDIADGWTVVPALELLAARVTCPVYFVLGNHDFYHRSIAAVRAQVRAAIQDTGLVYLPDAGVVALCPGVALVGHDGWADGRNGDFAGSSFAPNDFNHIHDFQVFGEKTQRLRLMQSLAGEAAEYLGRVLPEAAGTSEQVLVVTHVPPFAGASWYRGRPSGADRLPFYSSRCIGDVLLDVMARHPECQATVLAGHTHGACRFEAAANVEVRTTEAEYGKPRIGEILKI